MIIVQNSITPLGLSTTEAKGSGQFKIVKLPYQVLGERIEFWSDDDIGAFYAYFPVPPSPDVQTVIKITKDNAVVDQVVLPYTTTSNRFSFLVDLDQLPLGDFTAEVGLLSHATVAEGGLTISGDAKTTNTSHYSYTGQGGLITNGNSKAVSTVRYSYVCQALLIMTGSAVATTKPNSVRLTSVGTGGVTLKGAAGMKLTKKKPKTFMEWLMELFG